MSSKQPKSLLEIVNSPGSGIGALAASAQSRVDLADHLRGSLPRSLAAHLLAANVNSEACLVVLCDGPEWAARLRYESTTLLSRCREWHASAARVRIRVASDAGPLRDPEN
jgi:hypothetical protein